MFHVASVVFVAPLALLDAIRDVEAVRAEVVIAAPDDSVVALAVAAVGGLPAIVPVLFINLDRDTERRRRMEMQLQQLQDLLI